MLIATGLIGALLSDGYVPEESIHNHNCENDMDDEECLIANTPQHSQRLNEHKRHENSGLVWS